MVGLGVMIGVVLYRMAVLSALYLRDEELLIKNASMVTTATAACINLVMIFILNYVSNTSARLHVICSRCDSHTIDIILITYTELKTQNSDIFYLTLLIHYQNYCCKYVHIS